MQTQQIPKQNLNKWADNLYAIGKTVSDKKLALDLIDLAKMMYSYLKPQSGVYADVPTATLKRWRRATQTVSMSNKTLNKEVLNEILRIDRSIEEYLSKKIQLDQLGLTKFSRDMSELLWKSIVLSFTLWYGGQSFSLSNKELNAELGLNQNAQIKRALEELHMRSVFSERGTGLIVLEPRFKRDVDMATLFLISLGANLTSRLNLKRGYSTIQAGFLEFSKYHHHPMAWLAESVRSYISDYCQRVFAKLFKVLEEGGFRPDYSSLRRFLTRLSLYSSLGFVISDDYDVKMLVKNLESLRTIVLVSGSSGEKYILLKKELLKD